MTRKLSPTLKKLWEQGEALKRKSKANKIKIGLLTDTLNRELRNDQDTLATQSSINRALAEHQETLLKLKKVETKSTKWEGGDA